MNKYTNNNMSEPLLSILLFQCSVKHAVIYLNTLSFKYSTINKNKKGKNGRKKNYQRLNTLHCRTIASPYYLSSHNSSALINP